MRNTSAEKEHSRRAHMAAAALAMCVALQPVRAQRISDLHAYAPTPSTVVELGRAPNSQSLHNGAREPSTSMIVPFATEECRAQRLAAGIGGGIIGAFIGYGVAKFPDGGTGTIRLGGAILGASVGAVIGIVRVSC